MLLPVQVDDFPSTQTHFYKQLADVSLERNLFPRNQLDEFDLSTGTVLAVHFSSPKQHKIKQHRQDFF
jgi:hypothetical protein